MAIGLLVAPYVARADEVDGAPREKTLFLILLSFGKGDEAALRQLKSELDATGRVKVTESSGGADFIGKLEIRRTPDAQTLTATVLTRGGEVLVRSSQKARSKGALAAAIELMAWDIATAVGNGRAAEPERVATPPPSEEPMERVDTEPVSRRQQPRYEEPESEPSRLSFIVGAELGGGPWFADSEKIVSGSVTGFDFSHYGPAFTRAIDGRLLGGLNLHGGWRFFRAAGIEAAVQTSAWGNEGKGAGGAILVGGRFIGLPLEAFIRDRKYDLSLELGAGYSFVGGPYYDMGGKYLSLGIGGEYRVKPWLSLQVNYRMFMSFLNRFYVDYANDVSEPVKGFTAYWHTLTVGVAFLIHTRL